MADTKASAFAAATPISTDLVPWIDDPGGTPLQKQCTFAALISALMLSNVTVQVLTAGTTTYTPTSGMKKVLVICQGGGGGTPAETVADAAISGGGGGGCAIRLFTAAEIGADEACVVGATSTGAGNNSTFSAGGTLLTATGGGVGVSTGNLVTVGMATLGGAGGTATGGNINIAGQPGGQGIIYSSTFKTGGNGGCAFLGGGGRGQASVSSGVDAAGEAAPTPGGGGAGGGIVSSGADIGSAAGSAGVIYCIEFLA